MGDVEKSVGDEEGAGREVWPPAPLFRPVMAKRRIELVSLWIVVGINAVCGLLLAGWWVHHRWQAHRGLDWRGAAEMGACFFAVTTVMQLLLRWGARGLNRERARLENGEGER